MRDSSTPLLLAGRSVRVHLSVRRSIDVDGNRDSDKNTRKIRELRRPSFVLLSPLLFFLASLYLCPRAPPSPRYSPSQCVFLYENSTEGGPSTRFNNSPNYTSRSPGISALESREIVERGSAAGRSGRSERFAT